MFENKDQSKTPIADIGEFGLIKHLTSANKKSNATTVMAVGDDAAVIENTQEQTLLSTDMLVEGVHFDLSYAPLKHLGYKAVAVNLSDICAMNGIPSQITVSLALSNRFTVEAIEELYKGIYLACDAYGVDLVGGDTTSSNSGLIISVSVIGQVKAEDVCYRHMAKEKDLVVVSGDLGAAYMGLQLLQREKAVFEVNPKMQPELEERHAYMLERQLKPEARKDIIELLKKMELKPNAMIDISDGLSSEVLHLCEESGLGCRIYEDKLPIDPQVVNSAEEFGLHPSTCALNGGEDYELLFTISMDDFDKIKGNPNLTVIGHMTGKEDGANLISSSGEMLPLTAQGWNGFSEKE